MSVDRCEHGNVVSDHFGVYRRAYRCLRCEPLELNELGLAEKVMEEHDEETTGSQSVDNFINAAMAPDTATKWLAEHDAKVKAQWDAEFRAAWNAEHPSEDEDEEWLRAQLTTARAEAEHGNARPGHCSDCKTAEVVEALTEMLRPNLELLRNLTPCAACGVVFKDRGAYRAHLCAGTQGR